MFTMAYDIYVCVLLLFIFHLDDFFAHSFASIHAHSTIKHSSTNEFVNVFSRMFIAEDVNAYIQISICVSITNLFENTTQRAQSLSERYWCKNWQLIHGVSDFCCDSLSFRIKIFEIPFHLESSQCARSILFLL